MFGILVGKGRPAAINPQGDATCKRFGCATKSQVLLPSGQDVRRQVSAGRRLSGLSELTWRLFAGEVRSVWGQLSVNTISLTPLAKVSAHAHMVCQNANKHAFINMSFVYVHGCAFGGGVWCWSWLWWWRPDQIGIKQLEM